MAYYYTYYSYEQWGRGYIGVRKSKVPPEQDVRYMGSYLDKTFKPTEKIILQSYNSLEEAICDEIKLHEFYEVNNNSHFANRSKQTSSKFILHGEDASKIGVERWKKISKEERSKMFTKMWAKMTDEERSERTRKGWENISDEERSRRAKQRSMGLTTAQRAEISRKTMMKFSKQQRVNNARNAGLKGGVVTSSQKWQCTETGFISNAGVLAKYQRKRGIDTSKRIRLE